MIPAPNTRTAIVRREDLIPAEKFLLSFPLKPELYARLIEKFAPLPLIIINEAKEILFGIDLYRLIEMQNIRDIQVLQINISDKEGLFLNYNLKDKFTGLNLYEKLVFIKRISPLCKTEEIYRKTDLDIALTPQLTGRLDLLLSTLFRGPLINEQIDLKTGLKLCDFNPDDCEMLLQLFIQIPFSSSHRLKILELAEEIIFREKSPLNIIFEKLNISALMETERPQKKILNELFTFRYPRYMEAEEKWNKEIRSMKIPNTIKVTHHPFFEKKQIDITMQVKELSELKKILGKITGKKD